MTVSNPAYLQSLYNTARAMGDKAISSDAAFEIEGFEQMWLLTKQFPWPELSSAGEIEIPMPLGAAKWEAQQVKINQQGQITLMETKAGHVSKMMLNLIRTGGKFNAKVYEGTPSQFSVAKPIYDCFIQLDNPDRDWENRSQVLNISGTLFFHYFNEEIPGNI
ncbi:MAG: hypothetical protein JWQ61_2837 [Collimonas fungivorans]|uniref:hypothetical protein n=1 Tax=Collimonas fungivorans TaxID=158899 RepID=UPI0026F282AB|nr:hypothetical protein [Collimonas fungivorans]MDB5768023.1 hypothetical protein [Collimonas fungivorans]